MPIPTITQRYPPLPLDEVVDRIASFGNANAEAREETIRTFVAAHPIMCYDWGGD